MTKLVFLAGILFLSAGCSTIQSDHSEADRHPAAHGSIDIRNPSNSRVDFAIAPADGKNNWQTLSLDPGRVNSASAGDAIFLLRLRTQAEMFETERIYIIDGRGKYQFAYVGERWVLQSLSPNSGQWNEAPRAK